MMMTVLGALWQDVRYGLRVLHRNLRFTAAAVVALALGIGINTAVFTAYKAMVARPLDARHPGEMVNLALSRQSGATDFTFSYPDYLAYRDSVRGFSGLIAYSPDRMTLSNAGAVVSQQTAAAGTLLGRLGLLSPTSGSAEFASVYVVSENYFSVLGATMLRGDGFGSSSAFARADSPVLVSDVYWERRFENDPSVLGKTVRLNGADVTVAGIVAERFVGTGVAVPDFWLPMRLEPLVHADPSWLRDREHAFCRLFGRLAQGITIPQAQAEVSAVAESLRSQHDPRSDAAKPATALVWPGSPFPLPFNLYSGLKLTIALIMAAAAMVLVVACANVASLRLASAGARQVELRTRLSLGATRLRIIRQLLTESAILGLVAGAIALAFAWALLRVAVAMTSAALPVEFGSLVFDVTPDLTIFAFVFAISLAAGVLFGLAPAVDSSGPALSSSVRAGTAPRRTRRLQSLMVGAQVALSLLLMIAGGQLVHGAMQSLSRAPGYDAARVLDLDVQFPETATYSKARKAATIDELRARLAVLPDVSALTSAQPPDANRFRTGAVPLDGGRATGGRSSSVLYYTYVEPNYFRTLGIPAMLGRGFEGAADSSHAVVLSESAARQLWPDGAAVGRRVRLGATDEQPRLRPDFSADGDAYDVVGVVRDTRGIAFDGSDAKQVYLRLPENKLPGRPLLILARGDAASLPKVLESAISSVDPDLVTTSSTLQDRLRRSAPFVVSSLSAAVASTLGLLGLLLASMGIYGTVSYVVVARTRELGIRLAIGAKARDILSLILLDSTRPVLAGLLAGIVVALGASYLLNGVFYGIGTMSPLPIGGVTALFLAIAIAAAYPPARRALHVDPVAALRSE